MTRKNIIKPEQHGTTTGWTYGCRLACCRKAHREDAARRNLDPKYSKASRDRVRRLKKQRLLWIQEIKLASGCMDCGYKEHPEALEFDHRPGTEKLFNIGTSKLLTEKTILAEIAKCDIVCANCHRVRGAKRREANANPPSR